MINLLNKLVINNVIRHSHPRSFSTLSLNLPKLPDKSEWKSKFSFSGAKMKGRNCFSDLEIARKFVRSMGIDKLGGNGKPVTIIDAYAGVGLISRALLELPNVDKVISIEPASTFKNTLSELSSCSNDRLSYIEKDPYDWNVYTYLDNEGYFNTIDHQPWLNEHQNFAYLIQVPATVYGEQLIGQFFNCMISRSWLFNKGRLNMGMLINIPSYERLAYPAGHPERGRISVIREATASIEALIDEDELLPQFERIYPQSRQLTKSSKNNSKLARNLNYIGVKFTPHSDIIPNDETLDAWEFVTRQLYITRRTSLKKSLKHLAVNADVALSQPLEEKGINLNKYVRELTLEEVAIVVDVFLKWPFKPEILFRDDVDDKYSKE